jgi:hypothetical protein
LMVYKGIFSQYKDALFIFIINNYRSNNDK